MENCVKVCLMLLIISRTMTKKGLKVVLEIAKYVISALLGYLGSSVI